MEPRQEAVPGRVEVPLVSVNGIESPLGVNLEAKTGSTLEQSPQTQGIGVAQQAVQAAMPVLPAPVSPVTSVDDAVLDGSSPIVANDDDLIEKEWVDKAKQIIASTKDDPYKREREVSKLQIEYIRRRYGREIGNSGD